MSSGRLHDLQHERPRLAALDREDEASGVEAAGGQHLLDDPREPVRLARDHGQETAAVVVVKLDVLAAQRHRGAVDGRERRPELMRDRGHELALQPLDAALLGEVAQRVDRPVGELDGRDRDPELPVAKLERERLGVLRSVDGGAGDRHERLDRRPAGKHLVRRASEGGRRSEPRHRRDRRVPEADDAGAVDEEDPVADVGQDARGPLPLLLHLLLQACSLEDVAGLVGDQLRDGDRDAVEPARRCDGIERQGPDRVALVADRHGKGAACADGLGQLHLQATLVGDLVDDQRPAPGSGTTG